MIITEKYKTYEEVVQGGENLEGVNSIQNNLVAPIMRLGLENKELLREKGSLYVGTGETQTFEYYTENGDPTEVEIPVTAPLIPPQLDNDKIAILCWSNKGGISW